MSLRRRLAAAPVSSSASTTMRPLTMCRPPANRSMLETSDLRQQVLLTVVLASSAFTCAVIAMRLILPRRCSSRWPWAQAPCAGPGVGPRRFPPHSPRRTPTSHEVYVMGTGGSSTYRGEAPHRPVRAGSARGEEAGEGVGELDGAVPRGAVVERDVSHHQVGAERPGTRAQSL